jgi:CheY-like chemotaxis protein
MAAPEAPVSRIALRLPGVRILLVEDDVHVRESTAALFEMQGARVTTAESAAAAIEAFRGLRPDIVISDLGLPGEDGYMFLRRLRALDAGSDVPVIAFSGYARESEAARCREAGCAAYLVKPVDPEVMMRTVAATLAADADLA